MRANHALTKSSKSSWNFARRLDNMSLHPTLEAYTLFSVKENFVKTLLKLVQAFFFVGETKLLTPAELKSCYWLWNENIISEDELVDSVRGNLGLKTSEELKTKITKMLREIKKHVRTS